MKLLSRRVLGYWFFGGCYLNFWQLSPLWGTRTNGWEVAPYITTVGTSCLHNACAVSGLINGTSFQLSLCRMWWHVKALDLIVWIDKMLLRLLIKHMRWHMEGMDFFAQIRRLGLAHLAHPIPINSLGSPDFHSFVIFLLLPHSSSLTTLVVYLYFLSVFWDHVSFSSYHSLFLLFLVSLVNFFFLGS